MALAIHKLLELNVPVSVPGTALSVKCLVPLSQAALTVKLFECRTGPFLAHGFGLAIRSLQVGTRLPDRWTSSLRDLLRRSVGNKLPKRPRYQIRPEAGFGPKMGPGPKKADFGRGGQI